MVEYLVTVHEDDLAPLANIELLGKPTPGRFRYLSRGDEEVVEQDFAILFSVENR